MFITFEGIDGSGKSTQIQLLKKYLIEQSFSVLVTSEPAGSSIGKKITYILKNKDSSLSQLTEFFLFLACRSEHVSEIIEPALKEGKIVISSRYIDSTIAFQGYGLGIELSLVKQLNDLATRQLKPDLTFLLDLDPEISLKRKTKLDRIEARDIAFYRRVREGYLKTAEQEKERFYVIDSTKDIKHIHQIITREVTEKLIRC